MQESQGAGEFVFFQDMIHNDSDNKIFEKREKKLGEGHDEHAWSIMSDAEVKVRDFILSETLLHPLQYVYDMHPM